MKYLHLVFLIYGLCNPVYMKAVEPSEEVSKKIEKVYQISGSEIFEVKNKLGKIEILTWDKSEAWLEILITAKAGSREKAEEKLEDVDIRERSLGSKIQLETRILNSNLPFAKLSGISVEYTLYLPTANPLEIEQGSGSVRLERRTGNVDIQLHGGSLETEELLGEGNNLDLEFVDAKIGYIAGGDIHLSIGSISIEEAGDISLKSNTSRVRVNKAISMEIFANLGEIRINEIENLVGDYTSAKFIVGKLSRSLEIEAKYATAFEIEEVSEDFERINLQTTFANVDLKFSENALFELQAETKTGNLDTQNLNMEISEAILTDKRSQYQANPGQLARTDRPAGRVSIVARNGKVKLSR